MVPALSRSFAKGDKEICDMKKAVQCGYIFTLLVIILAVCCGKLAAQAVSTQQNSPTVNFIEQKQLRSNNEEFSTAEYLYSFLRAIELVVPPDVAGGIGNLFTGRGACS